MANSPGTDSNMEDDDEPVSGDDTSRASWSPCQECQDGNLQNCHCPACAGDDEGDCWCCTQLGTGSMKSVAEPFTMDFGIKAGTTEVVDNGETGLLLKGYASKFNKVDLDGEYQVPGSFSDIADTWGREKDPMIMYQHGLDPILTTRRIGRALKWVLDSMGLYVEVFIPKNPGFTDPTAIKRFAQVYNGIKAGKIRGFSVGGTVMKLGKALLRWSMSELTVTPKAALPSATFETSVAVGIKSVKAVYGDIPPAMQEGGAEKGSPLVAPEYSGGIIGSLTPAPGMISRSSFSRVMHTAQRHHDTALHDHLLERPAEHQGQHDSENCAICAERRTSSGHKAVVISPDDWVCWETAGATLIGKVASVHDGKVPGVPSTVYGSADIPAARIEVFAQTGKGYKPMGLHVGALVVNLFKVAAPVLATPATPAADAVQTENASKSGDTPLDEAALRSLAERLYTRLEADRKIGRRHSKATLERVRGVIEGLKGLHKHLSDEFGVRADDAAESAEE